MKQKKGDMVDRAEIIDDPTKNYQQLMKIQDELGQLPELEKNMKTYFNQYVQKLNSLTIHDPEIRKSDTVDCIKLYFDKIIEEINNTYAKYSSTVREKLYYIIYQICLIFFDYIHKMRKYNYSIHGTKYILWMLSIMESNIVLSHIKYMKWRVALYIELASLYEDIKAYKSSYNSITQGINRLNELKAIEEQAKPLPDYMQDIFIENFKYLKYAEFKYGILSGALNLDSWKKKLEETFNVQNNDPNKTNQNEVLNRNVCAINTMSNLSYYHSIVNHDGLKFDWKSNLVQYVYNLLKPDIENIKKGILERIDRKKRDIELDNKIKQNEKNYEDILNEAINANNEKNITNFRQSSLNVPIEIHIELLKECYDCKLFTEFIELNDSLSIRIKYREVEMPYVSEIDIQMSSIQYANIPTKYEKIPLDLNVNDYKRQIKNLREEGKYMKRGEEEKNDDKGDKNKKNQPPAKKDPKKDAKGGKKGEKTYTDDAVPNPYEKIDNMEHNFVYLLLKRSHNPNNAIVNLRVVMSNDVKIKKELNYNERAIAIPIKTYKDNLYEPEQKININAMNNKYLPYLIIQKGVSGSLTNDNEKLSAIIDVYPLISNCPYAAPMMNYIKIDPELTIPGKNNDPNYIDYNFDHYYVNFTYKTDKMYYVIERESELMRNLYELENSYVEPKENVPNDNSSRANNFLHLYYSFEKLDLLATWIFNALQSECGSYFLEKRSNFLYDICVLIFKKYLKDFLYQIEYFYEVQNELDTFLSEEILGVINSITNSIFNTLYCVHYILSKIKEKDLIIFSYISLYLGDYCERTGNVGTGVVVLRETIEYINKKKEKEDIYGLDNRENKQTFTSFTCDNNKIFNLNNEINSKFDEYVKKLNKKRRVNYKKVTGTGMSKIDNDLVNEEDFEVNYLEDSYVNSLLPKDKNENAESKRPYNGKDIYIKDPDNKDNLKINYAITEYENNLNCILINLEMKYYRMYIKSGDGILEKMEIYKNDGKPLNKPKKKQLPKINLPEKTLKKLDLLKGATAKQVKTNMEYLKHSLQDAGKLQPDKPILTKSEKTMKNTISKNCYLMALFNSTMALMRPLNKQDQIYLLKSADENINQILKEENERYEYYIKYFFHIKSLERFNVNTNEKSYYYYPYNLLYKPIMIDNVEKIPEPILIHKTSQTCSFIFPLIKIKRDQLDKINHNISKIKIFGQLSTGSNIVQLNNTNLENTNKIFPIIDAVTIPKLKENEKYIFAYAGYDNDDTIVNTIGATSKEIELYFPLPIHYISFQMCKVAFEYKHYLICKERAKVVFNYFTERSDIKDINLDNKNNTVLFYKLKYDYIYRTSLIELEGIAYCFYFFAKSCILIKQNDHLIDNKSESNVVKKQKNLIKNLNVLNLGLEIAIYLRNNKLIKMFVVELYNISFQVLNKKNLYKELLNIVMKMNLGLNMIPSEYWDITIRKISSLLLYSIFLLGNMINETDIIKKSLAMSIGVMKKKYHPFNYIYLQKEEEEVKDPKKGGKDAKDKKDDKKSSKATPTTSKEKNEENGEEDNTPKFKEIKTSTLKDIEREIYEIDDFILSCGDYNDLIKLKLDTYLSNLDKLNMELNNSNAASSSVAKDAKKGDKKQENVIDEESKDFYPNLQNEIERYKGYINDLIEVWNGYKSEGIKFLQKYITSGAQKDKFYEYMDKMLKKTIESYISSLYSSSTSSDAKDKKGKDSSGSNSNFVEVLQLVDQIQINQNDIDFIQNIFNQKISFLTQDILYKMKVRIHDYLNTIKLEMPNDKVSQDMDIEKMGNEIEEKFFGVVVEKEMLPPYDTLSQNDIIGIKEKLFWIGDIIYNKGVILYYDLLQSNHNELLNYDFNNFFNFRLCDIKKIDKYGEKKENDDLKLIDIRLGYFNKKDIKVEEKKVEVEEEEKKVDPKDKKKVDDKKKKAKDAKKKDPKDKEEEVELDPFDDLIDRNLSERSLKLNKVLEKFAIASLCINDVENYCHFDSLITFVYNMILYDMLTPYACCDEIIVPNEDDDDETNPYKKVDNNIWIYLNIIAEVAINRLNYLKKGNLPYNEFDYNLELEKLKNFITGEKFNAPVSNFNTLSKNIKVNSSKIDEENLLSSFGNYINIDVYIEFITFVIQCTYYKQKWSILSDLIVKFNNSTNELFSQFTLAFLIEAQKNIYEKAHLNTQNKQNELNHRVELYENWKNSRKNKRQQLITGEIPPEQIEFDRDYSVLSKELFIFKSISEMYRTDKEKSEHLYNSFLNDANNALKAVDACRKKYEDYQTEVISMEKYKYNFNTNYKEYISKVKAINYLQNNILGTFKNCIQVLKKRQENYLLIQIIYEMSLIMYSIGDEKNRKNSEVYFSEAIDTVFQKLYSIKGFRDIKFEDYIHAKGDKNIFVLPSFCYAIKILHKMGKYCYDNLLYNQRECALFASKICFNLLNNIIPNPIIYAKFGTYRLNEINANVDIFSSKFNIKVPDLLVSCIELVEILISYNDYENALPLLCLSDYLSCDICKNINYTLYSRILKIICLSEIGYINEAMMNYYKIIKKYDMPTYLSLGYKEYFVGKYANLTHNDDKINYSNNLPSDDQNNINAINNLIKLQVDEELKKMLGGNLFYYLQYSKLVLLYKVYNKDNYIIYPDRNNFVDQRSEIFIRLEKECRENIEMLSAYEDICFLSNCEKLVKMYDINLKDNLPIIKNKKNEICDKLRITSEDVKNFITPKFNKNDIELSKERYELIFNYRLLLSKVFECQGLYLQSSMVLYKAIENFKNLSKGESNKILNFDNSEDTNFDFKPTEISLGGGGGAKGKNPKDAKKDTKPPANAKKDAKGKKDVKDNVPEGENVDPDLQIKNLMKEISKIIYNNERIIPNSVYWFKLHYYHLVNLYKMNRLDDALFIIKKMIVNSDKVFDTYYYIRCKEIETMIYIQKYEIPKSEKCMNEITERGKINNINDYEICAFYSNYAEYLYKEKNYDLAINFLKNARNILWEKYAHFNYLIQPQTVFSKKVLDNLYIDKEMLNNLIDKENNSGAGGGSKKDPKGKDGSSGGNTNLINYIDTSNAIDPNNQNYDKDNYQKPKIEYDENTFENLYYKYTDLICKIELKYVIMQIMSDNTNVNLNLCLSVLKDLEFMLKKRLYPHTYYLIVVYYSYGMISKINFINAVKEFLKTKFLDNEKMLKKNNLEVLTVNKDILYQYSHYFNEKCAKVFLPLLKESKSYFEKSLEVAKTDFFLFENGFSLLDLTTQLADINILIAEYQIHQNLKYADINQVVNKINTLMNKQVFYDKENDDLPMLKEEFLEDNTKSLVEQFKESKTKSEKIEYNNYIRDYMYYTDLSLKIKELKRNLEENSIELASNSSLVDPSKLPKDIALQILENDYITKKKNKEFTQEIVVKNGIDTFDVFNILKNLMKEIEYFNFNFLIDDNLDDKIKNLSRLHKFLKSNSSNYSTKCYFEFQKNEKNESQEKIDFIQNDQVTINYTTLPYEIINHISDINSVLNPKETYVNLIYLLGNNSGKENTEEKVEEKKQPDKGAKGKGGKDKGDKGGNTNTNQVVNTDENCEDINYGRILMSEKFIQMLNQKIYNLKIKCRNSMTLSEEKRKRDFKYYQIEYYELIYEFIREMLKGKKQFAEMKGIKEVFLEDDIGEVNIESLDFWYNLLNISVYNTINQKYNALLRKVHEELVK